MPHNPEAVLLDLFNEHYVAYMFNVTEGSNKQHRIVLKQFGEFLGRVPRVQDLTRLNFLAFIKAFQEGRSPNTVNTAIGRIAAFWRFLAANELAPIYPFTRSPRLKAPKRIPRAHTIDDLRRLLKAAGQLNGRFRGAPWSLIMEIIIRLIWDCDGERIGALQAARWEDVDFAGRRLMIRAETRKCGDEDVLYDLRDVTVERLAQLACASSGDTIVPAMSPSHFRRWSLCMFENARVPHTRNVWHGIRRSVASYGELAQPGMGTNLLRHSSAAMTKRHYIDPRICERQSAVNVLPSLDAAEGVA